MNCTANKRQGVRDCMNSMVLVVCYFGKRGDEDMNMRKKG